MGNGKRGKLGSQEVGKLRNACGTACFFSFKCLAVLPGKDGREEAMKRREKAKFEVKAERFLPGT
jgi:hypothetical protein